MRKPDYERGNVRLWQGDCLELLPQLPCEVIDAVVTDPPYSSGGLFRGDRVQSPVTKYVQTDSRNTCRVEFSGDNRDQRSYLLWSLLWLSACHRIANVGAVVCCCTDWRQLPTLSDAIQCAGWVWRGIATWWKPGIRMQKGRFSFSSEHVLYGTNGIPAGGEGSPQNVFQCAPVPGKNKTHIAEKPAAVVDWILGATPPNCTVLDPFLGSGVVGERCVLSKRPFMGIELDPRSFDVACRRIDGVFDAEPLFAEIETKSKLDLFAEADQ